MEEGNVVFNGSGKFSLLLTQYLTNILVAVKGKKDLDKTGLENEKDKKGTEEITKDSPDGSKKKKKKDGEIQEDLKSEKKRKKSRKLQQEEMEEDTTTDLKDFVQNDENKGGKDDEPTDDQEKVKKKKKSKKDIEMTEDNSNTEGKILK